MAYFLKKYTPNVVDASEEHIKAATKDTIPNVTALFFIPCHGGFRFLNATFIYPCNLCSG